MLSRIVVVGQINPIFFFQKKKDFELHVFYTAEKNTILQIELHGDANISDLKLTFKIGDNISKAEEWVEKNGHKIEFRLNK